ncbi:hypothetical protein AAEP93_001455 [Penicillium crustosum]
MINPIFWKLDDALVANYSIAFSSVQPGVILAVTIIENKSVTAPHTSPIPPRPMTPAPS